jgi:hypothetical protein
MSIPVIMALYQKIRCLSMLSGEFLRRMKGNIAVFSVFLCSESTERPKIRSVFTAGRPLRPDFSILSALFFGRILRGILPSGSPIRPNPGPGAVSAGNAGSAG